MASDYSKLKNAELEALLKERQLPHAGKKAEMVARLTEHDQAQKTAPSSTAATATTASAGATSEPAAAAIAAGGASTRAPNPVAVPNQAAAVDPAQTSDLTATKDTTATTEAAEAAPAPASTFTSSLQLAPTDIDAEIVKRKARAAKFGIGETDNDAIKALERAKRFGTGAAGEKEGAEGATGALGVSRLDGALPERGERKRGRVGGGGAGDADAYADEGLKRRRGGGRDRGGRAGNERRDGPKGTPGWMTDADRAAAEKRKAKFGTPA